MMYMDLTEIPGRAFLDTSVVNFIIDYGEQIHDGALMPENGAERVIRDIESFRNIFLVGQRASWQLAISPFTYKEVISTTNPIRRKYLETWFFEIWYSWRETIDQNNDSSEFIEAERIRVEILASGILDAIPDIEDRILICDALAYRCDCFCTRDWSTIIKHRDTLSHLPIKILTPTEWWMLILPYANLWA